MEKLLNALSWQSAILTVASYFASLAFYRLFLHPLSRFPGPKLAAITRYYEAYYDVVQNGKYIFKIAEMHQNYGPIVRISPYELHVNDPSFFEQLYRQEGRWDKYAWAYDAFGAPGATFCTSDHDVHRARRHALNPFFSKANVASRVDLIERNVEKLCDRIAAFAGTYNVLNLGAAASAFTRDVATEFIQGRTYNSLNQEDFNIGTTLVFRDQSMGRMTKHFPLVGAVMKAIPVDWVVKMGDEGTKAFFRYVNEVTQDTKELLAAASSQTPDPDASPTIVHAIVESDLPPEEKSFDRILSEVATVTGAGFETTANLLRLILYHVFSNPKVLQRLRSELASVATQPDSVKLRTLEQLPYLTSILMEGMRLSPAIAARMARIAPDRDLHYGGWRIPAGTPVGMTTLFMHMDESLYSKPKVFEPERWIDIDSRKKTEKTYAPFSRGTRNCLGMYLAWAEMYLVLAALVQRFNFEFEGASAEDFECDSDQFIIGTKGKGILNARVTLNQT